MPVFPPNLSTVVVTWIGAGVAQGRGQTLKIVYWYFGIYMYMYTGNNYVQVALLYNCNIAGIPKCDILIYISILFI